MNTINKIVQTLWTKPVFEHKSYLLNNRFNGGWPDKKYNYFAWTLSCLQFTKYYKNVELVTDKKGKELLIDILKLPYTNVSVELDCLNHYSPSLWTLPKIYSYKIQKEPFIHADGDVLIWERLNDKVEKAQLCSQQLIINHKPQYMIMDEIEENLDFIPECIKKDKQKNKILRISNAGLLGGNDLDFFCEYTEKSFEFIHKNLAQLDKLKSGNFGMIFEEYLFYCLANEKGKQITYLLDPIEDDFRGNQLIDFESVPQKTKFIHPIGTYKKYKQIYELLDYTLLINYPEYYYRIINLLNDFEI